MLRKIVILLSILMLLTGTAYAQDLHLGITLSLHHSGDESTLDTDILFGESEALILSGLFPSFAVSVPIPEETDLEIAYQEISMTDFFPAWDMMSVTAAWVSALESETAKGIYAGELFDEAFTAQTGTCSLADLADLFFMMMNNGTTQEEPVISESVTDEFIYEENEIQYAYAVYDSGKYATFSAGDSRQTFCTVSFDFSNPACPAMVFGYAENGKNYYWKIQLSRISDTEIHIQSSLLPDENKAGYRSISREEPIMEENWILKKSVGDLCFTCEMIPGNEMTPVYLSGSFSAKDLLRFQADIHFGTQEGSFISLTAFMDEEPVSSENLTILSYEDLTDPDNTNTVQLSEEAGVHAVSLYMMLLQMLPQEYMKLMTGI